MVAPGTSTGKGLGMTRADGPGVGPLLLQHPSGTRVKIMDSKRLSATFVELADTLVADFDVLDFSTCWPPAAPSCWT